MNKQKSLGILILTFIFLATYIFFTIFSLNKPFQADEAQIVTASGYISKNGLKDVTTADYIIDNPNLNCFGLWHIPTYPYLLGNYIKFFGASEVSIRSFSLIFNLFTLILVYLISKELFKLSKYNYLSVILFTVLPYSISGSLLVEVDNTLLLFFSLLFLYHLIKALKKNYLSLKDIILLGIFLGAATLSKETAIILLLPILIFFFFKNKMKEGLAYTLSIGIIGLFLMLLLWKVVTILNNLNFSCPFRFIGSTVLAYSVGGIKKHILYSLFNLQSLIYRTTPYFLVLSVLLFFHRFISYIKTRVVSRQDILYIYVFCVFFIYILVLNATSYGYPKYSYVGIPPLCILLSAFINKFISINWKKFQLLFIVAVMIFIYNFYVVNDPFKITHRAGYNILQNILNIIKYSAPLIIILPLIFTRIRKKYGYILLLLLVMFIVTSLYINLLHAFAKHNTLYNYGEKGSIEVAKFISTNIQKNETILGETEIGHYSNKRICVWGLNHSIVKDQALFSSIISQYNISFIVIGKYAETYLVKNNPILYNEIIETYPLVFRHGTYNVFKVIK